MNSHISDAGNDQGILWATNLLPLILEATLDGIIAVDVPDDADLIPEGDREERELGDNFDGVMDAFYPPYQKKKGGKYRARRVRVGDVMCGAGVDGAGIYGPALMNLMRKMCIKKHVDAAVDALREAVDHRADVLGPGRAPE